MKCVKVIRDGQIGYIQPIENLHTAMDDEFYDAEEGDRVTLEFIEISYDEFENLPDFEGW